MHLPGRARSKILEEFFLLGGGGDLEVTGG